MIGREATVCTGSRDTPLDGKGNYQVIEVHITGIKRPLLAMLPQAKWDAASQDSHNLVLHGIHKAMTEVLLLWSCVENHGEHFVNSPVEGDKEKD